MLTITDLHGQTIEITDLQLALLQADDYRHYRHFNPAYTEQDSKMQTYWEDMYQKLIILSISTEKAGDDALLTKLNRQVIFLNFEYTSSDNHDFDYAVADYFDCTLKVTLPKQEKFKDKATCWFSVELIPIYNKEEAKILLKNVDSLSQWGNLKGAIKAINNYVLSRPFTIVKYNRGEYQLLDPNGFDFIGQYVTLADAKRTCGYNFKREW